MGGKSAAEKKAARKLDSAEKKAVKIVKRAILQQQRAAQLKTLKVSVSTSKHHAGHGKKHSMKEHSAKKHPAKKHPAKKHPAKKHPRTGAKKQHHHVKEEL